MARAIRAGIGTSLSIRTPGQAMLLLPRTGCRSRMEAQRSASFVYFLPARRDQDVHQVSLEAGNSPQMVFAHYRQLVTETQATEWFGIVPCQGWKNVTPISSDRTSNQESVTSGGAFRSCA